MATSVATGSFTLNSSTGAQSVTGLGFQPKLVIFWAQQMTTVGGNAEIRRAVGAAASSTAQWTHALSYNVANNNHDQQFVTDKCFKWNDALNDVTQMAAAFTSMDVDGFTINVTTGLSTTINYFALGGTSVSVKVGTFNTATTNGTTQAVTGVGFTPKALLMCRGPYNTDETIYGEGHHMIGVADGTNKAVGGFYFEGNVPPPANSFQRTDYPLAMIDRYNYHQFADLTSFDADGFTLGYGYTYGAAAKTGYVALAGTANYKAFSFNTKGSTGSQSVTGMGFTPAAELFFSNGCPAANTTVQTNTAWTMGAAAGTTGRTTAFYAADSSTSATQPVGVSSTTNCFNISSTATASTAIDAASMTSQDSDGFTLNWGTSSGVVKQVFGLAIASTSASASATLTSVPAATSLGTVSTSGKCNVALTGVAATGSVGSVTAKQQAQALVTGLSTASALGSVTVVSYNNIAVTGFGMTASLGAATGAMGPLTIELSAVMLGMTSELGGAGVGVQLPIFGVLPDFTPDHPNDDADPSQPTRWVNVLPP